MEVSYTGEDDTLKYVPPGSKLKLRHDTFG